MAKAKKSKSGGKGKKGKSGGKGKKQKPGSRGKKDKSAGKKVKPGGKGKKDKSEDKRKEETTESEGIKDKPEGKGKRAKSKGSTDKSGSKGKKDKAGGKGKKGKTGSKGKKDKHGGKGKKDKPGSKGKKDKPGGKGKKEKAGGKAKKGTKDGSPPSGKKSGSERSSTPDSTIGSTLGQASVSATSSETLFKPLNRKPFSPLILPADRELTTVRRPNTVYIWEWDNIWFFPMSVVAMALVVLGMVVMSLSVQVADELQADDVNATGVANGTISGVANRTRRPSTEESDPNLAWTSRKPMRRAHSQNPDVAVPYIPEDMPTSKTWIESAVPTVFTGPSEDGASTFVIEQAETEEGHFKADSADDDMTTQTWFYAPMNGSRETSMANLPLFRVTKSKGVDSDARTQNATAVIDNEV